MNEYNDHKTIKDNDNDQVDEFSDKSNDKNNNDNYNNSNSNNHDDNANDDNYDVGNEYKKQNKTIIGGDNNYMIIFI